MAGDLTASVRREIDRLKNEIGRRESELESLKQDLEKHGRVLALLQGNAGPVRSAPARRRRRARPKKAASGAGKGGLVNWNAVLAVLPQRFTIADIAGAEGARGKNLVYLRQIAVRWAKVGKTKRIGRGRYQKAGGPEPRQTPNKRKAKRSK